MEVTHNFELSERTYKCPIIDSPKAYLEIKISEKYWQAKGKEGVNVPGIEVRLGYEGSTDGSTKLSVLGDWCINGELSQIQKDSISRQVKGKKDKDSRILVDLLCRLEQLV